MRLWILHVYPASKHWDLSMIYHNPSISSNWKPSYRPSTFNIRMLHVKFCVQSSWVEFFLMHATSRIPPCRWLSLTLLLIQKKNTDLTEPSALLMEHYCLWSTELLGKYGWRITRSTLKTTGRTNSSTQMKRLIIYRGQTVVRDDPISQGLGTDPLHLLVPWLAECGMLYPLITDEPAELEGSFAIWPCHARGCVSSQPRHLCIGERVKYTDPTRRIPWLSS